MIAVIDYGMGNIRSIAKALEFIGAQVEVCVRPEQLMRAQRMVLPGVGAFGDGMAHLKEAGLDVAIKDQVAQGIPLLGICLGMQLLASDGEEGGTHEGLGLIKASVKRFAVEAQGLKVPHVGWNEIAYPQGHPFFENLKLTPTFYFVHSYHMVCQDPQYVLARCDYGGAFTAAVIKNNIIATQFHPEKSQRNGITLLENFLQWQPSKDKIHVA